MRLVFSSVCLWKVIAHSDAKDRILRCQHKWMTYYVLKCSVSGCQVLWGIKKNRWRMLDSSPNLSLESAEGSLVKKNGESIWVFAGTHNRREAYKSIPNVIWGNLGQLNKWLIYKSLFSQFQRQISATKPVSPDVFWHADEDQFSFIHFKLHHRECGQGRTVQNEDAGPWEV